MSKVEESITRPRADRGCACPHLGTEVDISSCCQEPSRQHRCYLSMQRERIDLVHQATFCLTESHAICPWLSIHEPERASLQIRALPLWLAAREVLSRSARRAGLLWTALVIRLRPALVALVRLAARLAVAFWRWLRPAAVRTARFVGSHVRHGSLRLLQHAIRLGRRGMSRLRGKTHIRPTASHGASRSAVPIPAEVPVSPLPPSPAQPPVMQAGSTWGCDACGTINADSLLACQACGYPSPRVEEELMSSDDELLAQGLTGLKAGDEELAYRCFVKACKASPKNELAWHWRAKTAPTVDEVVRCLERLLELDPGNASVQAELSFALQRRQYEVARPPAPAPRPQAATGAPRKAATALRRIVNWLRWWLLQLAGVCAFVLALGLTLPYGLRLTDLSREPELTKLLKLLPGITLPELSVDLPYLYTLDLGSAVPLVLGLLLLHASFVIVDGGGLGARVWTALLGTATGALMLQFGANPPSSLIAAGLAALAAGAAVLGGGGQSATARGGAPAVELRGSF